MKYKILKVSGKIILIILLFASITNGDNNGTAGLHSNFNLGVGARALSLGNAYVAMPFDATAIYWNPSGLDHIQYKHVSMFYTNLLGGANYYFLGYVHPTISIGTFGAGIVSFGVNGVPIRDENNFLLGNESSSENMFLFSYGKKLPWNLSGGISLKIHYQDIVGYTATGVGSDVGVLYQPNFNNPWMSGLTLGFTIQNLVGPRLKANVRTDVLPVNVRLGMAKPIFKNEWGPQLTFFMDFEQGENVPFKYHAGTEYVFQNKAMLRVGMNNNQLSFGAGASLDKFQLDYSYGKFAEHELSPSHRVSFTILFGKTKERLVQIAEERRLQEIQEKVDQEIKWEREQRIAESMKRGKEFLEAEDYARAIREFNFVTKFQEEMPDNLVIEEARKLSDLAEEKSRQELTENIRETQARDEAERRKREEQLRLNQLHQQALAYFEAEDYERAIGEWRKMLAISPDNPIAKEHIAKAAADLERKILSLINQADRLGRQGQYYAAIKVLNKARLLNPDEEKVELIDQKAAQYDKQLTFEDLYQQGYRYYVQKDYENAMKSFEKALSYEPNNERIKKAFFDAKARANARKEPLTGDAREKYMEGIREFREGNYQKALDIWEVLLEKYPYNKYILDSIDMAREKHEQQQRMHNKQ